MVIQLMVMMMMMMIDTCRFKRLVICPYPPHTHRYSIVIISKLINTLLKEEGKELREVISGCNCEYRKSKRKHAYFQDWFICNDIIWQLDSKEN